MVSWRSGQRGLFVVLLGACLALAACGTSEPAVQVTPSHSAGAQAALSTATTTVQRTVTIGGMRRSYLAVGQTRRHSGLPLLVVLHGRGITARQEADRTGFLTYAEQGLADVVYPMGIAQSWNAGHGCCGRAAAEGVNDVGFVTEAVTDASRYFDSDTARVYLVGYSNGARLAFQEVCEHPSTFAAFATYGAVSLAQCTNSNAPPVPVLIGAGTEDPLVKAEGGFPSATDAVEHAATHWRTRNRCGVASTTVHTGPLTLTTWTGCAVATALYSGITHYWPTAAPNDQPFTTPVGPQAATATVMWGFLSGYRLAPR